MSPEQVRKQTAGKACYRPPLPLAAKHSSPRPCSNIPASTKPSQTPSQGETPSATLPWPCAYNSCVKSPDVRGCWAWPWKGSFRKAPPLPQAQVTVRAQELTEARNRGCLAQSKCSGSGSCTTIAIGLDKGQAHSEDKAAAEPVLAENGRSLQSAGGSGGGGVAHAAGLPGRPGSAPGLATH